VVVLWSFSSVASGWLRSVATEASQRRIVASALLDEVRPPLGFRASVVSNLTDWNGDSDSEEFQRLVKAVRRIASCETAKVRGDRSHLMSAILRPAEARGGPDASGSAPTPAARPDKAPQSGNDDSNRPRTLFLCYRRGDTEDAAGRLCDRLVAVYGAGRVFIDIDSVPLGIDFVDHVTDQISKCSAVIVMIGKQWLTIKDKKRRRRLDNEDDLVRAEIAAALKQKIPVIPVVVQNASMPVADDLPDDMRLLARRNGIQLRPEQWREGVERLLKELDKVMGPASG
jgi:hypothetical protein